MTGSFDAVADLYREQFAGELDAKPFDRDLLTDFARRLARETRDGPVLEVGAGPGHIAAFLAERGVDVLVSDGSREQIRQARILDASRCLVVADLACVPTRTGSLAAIVAFYCLIYGPPEHLDGVFADWHRALAPGGFVLVAVHAGGGTVGIDEWQGRAIDLTVVLRDPHDLTDRLARAGFAIEEAVTRPPYEDEHATDRCYIRARRA